MTPDLQTIGGVVALSVIITSFIVSKFSIDDNGTKKLISAGVAAVLAIGAHLTGLGFSDSTIPLLVAEIFGTIFANKMVYDSLVKPIGDAGKKKEKK